VQGVLRRIDHRVFILQLQHEAQHAAVEIEIRKQHVHSRTPRHGRADVQRDGRGAHPGFRGKDRKNLIGPLHDHRLALQQFVDRPQRFQYRLPVKGIHHEFPHADAHGLAHHLRIHGPMHRDNLNARPFRFQKFDDLQRPLQRFKAQEHDLRSLRAKRAQQVLRGRVTMDRSTDRHFTRSFNGSLKTRRQFLVRANDDASQHLNQPPLSA
jgi:hypothetical protein